jgi:cation diffusion facilitator family transporter
VALTGWLWLDPVVALAVAVNIVWTGVRIVRSSILGLMDTALPEAEQARIVDILERYVSDEVQYHALRTRRAGPRRFVSVHILVPGEWTVDRGHDLLERIEAELRGALPMMSVLTHLEPLGDPAAWDDLDLDRD